MSESRERPSRPGGELAKRDLHFIWLVDCSGSMATDGKVQALNNAIKEAVPLMRDEAKNEPNAQILVRALRFSSGAYWHVAEPTPIEVFRWEDVEAQGVTDLGAALLAVADELKKLPDRTRALPPVLVLLSDGEPTDDYSVGLQSLLAQPWGQKAVRIAIAIGRDANTEVLQRFIHRPELTPLQANNPESLVKQIKWVSTVVVKSASAPASQASDGQGPAANVPVPLPTQAGDPSAPDQEVW